MRTAIRVAAVVLLVACVLPSLASACPLCKEAAADADRTGGNSMWRGMYWSILFMIAMPFGMVGTMILVVVRARRRRGALAKPRPSAPLAFPGSGGARL